MNSKIKFLLLVFIVPFAGANSQVLKRALFIGNSYTAVNDLPLLVSKIAHAQGDSLYYDSNTPGGYTLFGHYNNPTSLSKIAQGNWDYVVLQAQSQEPAYTPAEVAYYTLPYAHKLDSLIQKADSCAETIFYMTWGRKNGDADNCPSNPAVCTYSGMQQRLRSSYLLMAQQNNASVAPVGAAWSQLRNINPPFDLYQSDESHPSIYGSYLAACVFYSSLFQKPVTNLNFTAGISNADAQLIQEQCNTLLFDSLSTWFAQGAIPFCSFQMNQQDDTLSFVSSSLNADSLRWSFGDGEYASTNNPIHNYSSNGTFTVNLTAKNSCSSSTYTETVNITTAGIKENFRDDTFSIFENENGLQLKSNVNLNAYMIQFFNLQGQVIYSSQAKTQLEIKLPSGLYFATISNRFDSKTYSIKFALY